MTLVGTALARCLDDERIGIIDSTPLEASQYDKYAGYHPLKHIFHLDRYPPGLAYSPETDADVTHLPALIEIVEPAQPHPGWVLLDTAYNHSKHMLRSGITCMPGHVSFSERGRPCRRRTRRTAFVTGRINTGKQEVVCTLPWKSETGLSGCSFGTKKSANP